MRGHDGPHQDGQGDHACHRVERRLMGPVGASGASQRDAWETMMRSHAIANGVFIAAPNRVGREGELRFWGASFVSDPNGNLLAKAAHEGEELLMAECDLGLIEVVRTHWPFLRDRRIDAYGDMTKRYLS